MSVRESGKRMTYVRRSVDRGWTTDVAFYAFCAAVLCCMSLDLKRVAAKSRTPLDRHHHGPSTSYSRISFLPKRPLNNRETERPISVFEGVCVGVLGRRGARSSRSKCQPNCCEMAMDEQRPASADIDSKSSFHSC